MPLSIYSFFSVVYTEFILKNTNEGQSDPSKFDEIATEKN